MDSRPDHESRKTHSSVFIMTKYSIVTFFYLGEVFEARVLPTHEIKVHITSEKKRLSLKI